MMKKMIISTLAVVMLCLSVNAATVAYWRLEEGSNGSTHGTNLDNYYTDTSGNGNHMSSWYYPAPIIDVPATTIPQSGEANEVALNFLKKDDSARNLMCLQTDNKPIDSYAFTNGFTIECAMKNRAIHWNAAVSKDGKNPIGPFNPFKLLFRYGPIGDARINYEFMDSSAIVHTSLESSFPYELDKWYWIACVCDGTQAWLYIKKEGEANYQEESHITNVVGGMIESIGAWSIARGCWDANNKVNALNGSVDEVRITASALLPNQFLAATGGAAVTPVAYWRFEEGTNGVHQGNLDDYYVDSSGNGNHMSTWYHPAPAPNTDVPFATVPLLSVPNERSLKFNRFREMSLGTYDSTKPIESYMFNNGWTLEVSFKHDWQPNYWEVLVSKDDPVGGGTPGDPAPIHLKLQDGSGILELRGYDDGGTERLITTINPTELQKWYSVAATFDPVVSNLTLYLKGETDSNYIFQGVISNIPGFQIGTWGTSSWTVARGMWASFWPDYVNASIDEVRITSEPLATNQFLASTGGTPVAPLAFWRFEEGTNGIHEADLDNYYVDSSGNGNHMSTINTVPAKSTATTNVPFANVPQTSAADTMARKFTPTLQNVGTFLDQTGSKMINSSVFTNSFTIECMAKPNVVGWQGIVCKQGEPSWLINGIPDPNLAIKFGGDSKIYFNFFDSLTNNVSVMSTNNYSIGQWYQIAAVCEGGTQALLYVKEEGDTDYELERTANVVGGMLNQANPWVIGCGFHEGREIDGLDGIVDEVRISDVALPVSAFLGSVPEPGMILGGIALALLAIRRK